MKRLRVYYDFEIFSDQTRGGITRYVINLAERVADRADVLVYAGFHRSDVVRTTPFPWMVGWYFRQLPKTGELRRRLNALLTQHAVRRFRPDIIHRSYYRHAVSYSGAPSKVVTTLHDFTNFAVAQNSRLDVQLQSRIRYAAEHSDFLIFVSESTRRDSRRFLPHLRTQSSVIHLATEISAPKSSAPQPKKGILFVGQRGGYKDFDLLLQALAVARDCENVQLVAFGGGDWTHMESARIRQLGLSDRITRTDGDDTALALAYSRAAALVYPSRYEGFGLPILEAMSCGCPVICSNTSSLPEVAGHAAEYFNAGSVDCLVAALNNVLRSPDTQQQLVRLGIENVKRFSWSSCADQTMDVYENLTRPSSSSLPV